MWFAHVLNADCIVYRGEGSLQGYTNVASRRFVRNVYAGRLH